MAGPRLWTGPARLAVSGLPGLVGLGLAGPALLAVSGLCLGWPGLGWVWLGYLGFWVHGPLGSGDGFSTRDPPGIHPVSTRDFWLLVWPAFFLAGLPGLAMPGLPCHGWLAWPWLACLVWPGRLAAWPGWASWLACLAWLAGLAGLHIKDYCQNNLFLHIKPTHF